MQVTRRALFASSAGCWTAAALAATKPRPLGINLYSIRDSLAKGVEPALARLAEIGYTQVELRPQNLTDWGPLLKKYKLQPVHMMIESACVTGRWDVYRAGLARRAAMTKSPAPPADAPVPTLAQMIDLAAKNGLADIGISYASPEERPEPDGWERYAEQLSKAAIQCKAAGIGLYHHNHSVELAGQEGKRPIDRIAKASSKDVGFEIDIFWAAVGGADPAKLIRQLKGRIFSFHLKDRAPGTPVTHELTGLKPEWFREVGEGDLDMKGILAAAKDSGARFWLVEQDFSQRDPLVSAEMSYKALRKLGA